MRAFAFLLLGLLALTTARPACATMAAPPPAMQGHGAHTGCPDKPERARHHVCAMAACAGCALGIARIALPAATALCPIAPPVAPVATLTGSGPAAATPPPRSFA